MNAYLKQVLTCTAVACLLLVVIITPVITPVAAQASGNYPTAGDFNGMSIQYTISGVTVNNTTDVSDFTTSRTLTGTVDPGASVHVSGTFSASWGYYADCSVTVSGAKPQTYHLVVAGSDGKAHPQSKSFSIDAPAQNNVSVSIVMIGDYNAGTRGLTVDGTFAGKSSAGGGGGFNLGGVSIPLNDAAALSAVAAAIGAATGVAVVGSIASGAIAAGQTTDSQKKDDDDKDNDKISYLLNLSKNQLLVALGQDDSFHATVYKKNPDGSLELAGGARMYVGSGGGVAISPGEAGAEETFTVRQTDAAAESSVTFAFVARADGEEISTDITVETTKPVLDAYPTEPLLLAFPDEKVGKADAPKTAEVRLWTSGGEGAWTFELAPSNNDKEAAEKIVTVSEPQVEGTQATFTIAVADQIERPTAVVGPRAWRRFVTLHSAASLETQRIEGPDVRVGVCFEGLFIEEVLRADKKGVYKADLSPTGVTIRVDTPLKAPLPTTEVKILADTPDKKPSDTAIVKFVAMVWDGTGVRNSPEVVRNLAFGAKKTCPDDGDCKRWTTIFDVLKADLIWTYNASADPYSSLSGTWSVCLSSYIPGEGQLARGNICVRAYWNEGDISEAVTKSLSSTIPIVLQIGEPQAWEKQQIEKERQRCLKMIRYCLPQLWRQQCDELLDVLDRKGGGAGADDYRGLAKFIWLKSQAAWEKEQDYYKADWSSLILEEIGESNADYIVAAKPCLELFVLIMIGPEEAAYYGREAVGEAFTVVVPALWHALEKWLKHYRGESLEEYFRSNWLELVLGIFKEIFYETIGHKILHHINLQEAVKDPTTLNYFIIFGVWKFYVHWSEDKEPDGSPKGLSKAFDATMTDLAMATLYVLGRDFYKWARGRWQIPPLPEEEPPGEAPGVTPEPPAAEQPAPAPAPATPTPTEQPTTAAGPESTTTPTPTEQPTTAPEPAPEPAPESKPEPSSQDVIDNVLNNPPDYTVPPYVTDQDVIDNVLNNPPDYTVPPYVTEGVGETTPEPAPAPATPTPTEPAAPTKTIPKPEPTEETAEPTQAESNAETARSKDD